MLIKSAKQRKTDKIHDSYENISKDYDAMNNVATLGMHHMWKLKLADEISQKKFWKILDVCCGTGDMALLLAEKNPEAAVTAIDFSEQMLKRARLRQKKKRLANVEFLQQNAEQMKFRTGQFDCVVICFGLRNVVDYEKVIREMYRVLRPGGFLYCMESSQPQDERMQTMVKMYRNMVVPAVSEVLAGKGKEYRRLAVSGKKFPTRKQLVHVLQKYGFSNVGYLQHFGGITVCHRGQKPEN